MKTHSSKGALSFFSFRTSGIRTAFVPCTVLVLSLFAIELQAQKPDDIIGKWRTTTGKSHIEIFKEDGKYHGKVVWLRSPDDDEGAAVRDSDGNLVMDMVVLSDFAYKDGKYVDGKVYDPEEVTEYYGSMVLTTPNTIKLRGSIDKAGWMGKNKKWTRVMK